MKVLAPKGDVDHRQRSVVVLLIMVVLVPSATVLWLTGAAVRNERAAVRQRLLTMYRNRLQLAAGRIDEHWESVRVDCQRLADLSDGAALFRDCVAAGVADSVLVLDSAGDIVYPAFTSARSAASFNQEAWAAANRLEFFESLLDVAAEAYAAIAEVEPNAGPQAQAWLAHARCLAKAGKLNEALHALTEKFNTPELEYAIDPVGRRLWLVAQLRRIQLMQEISGYSQELDRVSEHLKGVLDDYDSQIPPAQRIFAMQLYQDLFPSAEPFLTIEAERLVASERFGLDTAVGVRAWGERQQQWAVTLERLPLVLIYRAETMEKQLSELIGSWETSDASMHLLAAGESGDLAEVASVSPSTMPGWNLSLQLENPRLFADASRQQTALYTLAGLITVGAVAVGALAIAFSVRQQLRLAKLRNDLAAVVTHELRTPLASIRVLVDTLIDAEMRDTQQAADYLQLIAQENERLSRLIENFLTFSRIDRQAQTFDMQQFEPAELAERAVLALQGKLNEPGCVFETQISAELPHVPVDCDAIVTVLLNLLDNAMKFTGADKLIVLRVCRDEECVRFDVQDNGIGMSPAESRRAFNRFYQADTRLSRGHGGCGLGLSLVRSIVEAHGGEVSVSSVAGSGSTFQVRLPAVASP